jgi:hypothetical protein
VKLLYFAFILSFPLFGWPHEGKSHQEKTSSKAKFIDYEEINKDYERTVAPIFTKKCADCHSLNNKSPWYAAIPGIGWKVENDRTEAKEHLEISKGFPFEGHGTPAEDLDAIEETIKNDSMPTFLYRLAHPSSKLNQEEKDAIRGWIMRSKENLEKQK